MCEHRLHQSIIEGVHTITLLSWHPRLWYKPNFDENIREFAQLYKLDVISLRGNTDIVEKCYQKAKSSIRESMST